LCAGGFDILDALFLGNPSSPFVKSSAHLNFGWGGPYNGWYLLPDEIPYGLTVIEGLITDIAYPPVNTGLQNNITRADFTFNISPNPTIGQVTIETTIEKQSLIKIEICDINGSLLFSIPEKLAQTGTFSETLNLNLVAGLYLCKFQLNEKTVSKRFIIR